MESFTIGFNTTKSDPKTAIKAFESDPIQKQCTPYEALDDLNGYVIIDYDSNVMGCNYAEYDGKKYFVTDRVRQPGQKLQVRLRIDSLSTYWRQINQCQAMVRTTSNDGGWTKMIQGDRMIYSYQVTHATDPATFTSDIDFDSGHFYMGIYG